MFVLEGGMSVRVGDRLLGVSYHLAWVASVSEYDVHFL